MSDTVEIKLAIYANRVRDAYNRYLDKTTRKLIWDEHMAGYVMIKNWWEQRQPVEMTGIDLQGYLSRSTTSIPNRGYVMEHSCNVNSLTHLEAGHIVAEFRELFIPKDEDMDSANYLASPYALEYIWVIRHRNGRSVKGYKEQRYGNHGYYLGVNVNTAVSTDMFRRLEWDTDRM